MIPVLVTTINRGVYFGYLEDYDASAPEKLILKHARCAVYWDTDTIKGFLSLANTGPNEHCKISRSTNRITLFGVSTISECTDKAAAQWELAPWS